MVRIPFQVSDCGGLLSYYCGHCRRYKTANDFYACSIRRHDRRCRQCVRQTNRSLQRERTRIDPCRLLLRRTRRLAVQCNVACLLDLGDVHLLTKVVWKWKSAKQVAKDSCVEDLVLAPWRPYCALTPWNAVLLTKREARHHVRQPGSSKYNVDVEDVLRGVQKKYQRQIETVPRETFL